MSIVRTEIKVINGKVQKVDVFDWPKIEYTYVDGTKVVRNYTPEQKQDWLLSHGWNERAAYMIAFNISEREMKRIENSN